jgi:hypothetical protein
MKFGVEQAASQLSRVALFRALPRASHSFRFSVQSITLHCVTIYNTVHEIWRGTGR